MDTLEGAGGDDTLVGGPGADRLDGGAGTDTASYRSADTGVSVNLEDPITHEDLDDGRG